MLPENQYVATESQDDVRVRRTRVGIEHVLRACRNGMPGEQIAVELPAVTLEQVHGVIAYCLRHGKQVDGYLHGRLGQVNKARAAQAEAQPPGAVRRLREPARERIVG